MLARAEARAYAKVREADNARAAAADAKRKGPTATADDALESKKAQVYRCNRSGEEFRSFQALRGHRNAHRKLKLLLGMANDGPPANRDSPPAAEVICLPRQLHHSEILDAWTSINVHEAKVEGKRSWPAEKEAEAALKLQLNTRGTNVVRSKNENEEEDEGDRWVNAIIVDPEQQCPQVDRHVAAPEEEVDE